MEQIQDYIPVTKAKIKLLDLVRKINDSGDTVAITRNGVPEAVIMSMDKFQGLLETLDILADETAMKSIKKSIRQAEKGEWVSLAEAF